MISLKLLILINKHLLKTRRLDISLISIFKGLLLIVLMGDFYQFVFIIKKTL